jgi:UTP--glucose-1-phosphate uridylyltransferase
VPVRAAPLRSTGPRSTSIAKGRECPSAPPSSPPPGSGPGSCRPPRPCRRSCSRSSTGPRSSTSWRSAPAPAVRRAARHRPGQVCHRGPLRRGAGTSSRRSGQGQARPAGEVRHATELATVHSIRQGEALGLGHAVLQARTHVGDDASFVVALGDDIVDPDSDFLERMIAQHEATGRPVVALMEVPEDQVSQVRDRGRPPDRRRRRGRDQRPGREARPRRRPVEPRRHRPVRAAGVDLPRLADTKPGAGGEIQLTDALHTLAQDQPIVGVRLDDVRHDAGDKLGFLQATVDFASPARRPRTGVPRVAWRPSSRSVHGERRPEHHERAPPSSARGGRRVWTQDELLSVDTYREYVIRALPRPEPMEIGTGDASASCWRGRLGHRVAAGLRQLRHGRVRGPGGRRRRMSPSRPPWTCRRRRGGRGGDVDADAGQRRGHADHDRRADPAGSRRDRARRGDLRDASRVTIHVASERGSTSAARARTSSPGQRLLAAGRRIGPGDIALLIASGVTRVPCYPAPRVTIVSTGDELVPADRRRSPARSVTATARCSPRWCARPVASPTSPDRPATTARADGRASSPTSATPTW